MKRTTLNLLFLLFIGLVIGWKEWRISSEVNHVEIRETIKPNKEKGVILFNRAHLEKETIQPNLSSTF